VKIINAHRILARKSLAKRLLKVLAENDWMTLKIDLREISYEDGRIRPSGRLLYHGHWNFGFY